jgi:ABC-2 type transport system ATP-binding protein
VSVRRATSEGIRCLGLVRRFGPVVALAGIDLEVRPGEVVALLGPNGAGKSTLLRILSTLLTPDGGSASVCGVDVGSSPAEARKLIGVMIGDERSLYWRLSGRRNLLFYAALRGMGAAEAREVVGSLLARVGLTEGADRPVRGYSSGMRARLSLARALLGHPPVLLLDEPTRSLDPIAAVEFRELAGELAGEHRAVLTATHDLHEAVATADRVVVVANGRSVLEAPADHYDAVGLQEAFVAAVRAQGEGRGAGGAGAWARGERAGETGIVGR